MTKFVIICSEFERLITFDLEMKFVEKHKLGVTENEKNR